MKHCLWGIRFDVHSSSVGSRRKNLGDGELRSFDALNNLHIAEFSVGKHTEGNNLVENDAIGPEVRFNREDTELHRLGRHPPNRQLDVAREAVVAVRRARGGLARQSKVAYFHYVVWTHQAVTTSDIPMDELFAM